MDSQPKLGPGPATMAALLTCVGGYVDSIGYLHLGQLYVANMSGNSVAVGIHSAWLDWPQVSKHGWPIVSYVAGILLSRLILTWGESGRRKSSIALALTVEAAALSGFLAIQGGTAGVFLCASAMGIQAAAISKFDGVTIHTCFVTGSLVKMGENLADVLWTFWDSLRRSPHGLAASARAAVSDPRTPQFLWFGATWIAYITGAIAGTLALDRFGVPAVWGALTVIAGFAVLGFGAPGLFRQVR